MTAFRYEQTVLFRHCDPARIMFFPRMLELVNDAVESFFDGELGWPFHEIHPEWAVPTVEISTRFKVPCRLGETLTLAVSPTHIGRSSISLATRCTVGNETRFETDQTLVCLNANGRPTAWPENVRQRVTSLLERQE